MLRVTDVVVGCRLSVVGCQLSVVSCRQLSALSVRLRLAHVCKSVMLGLKSQVPLVILSEANTPFR